MSGEPRSVRIRFGALWAAAGAALWAGGARGAQDDPYRLPAFGTWPAPLVEITFSDQATLRGYLLEYREGRIELRTLDGQPDRTIEGPRVAGLRFLAPPKEPPARPPGNEPRDPGAPGRHWNPWRDALMERAKTQLTPEERQRLGNLERPEHPALTASEWDELRALAGKLVLPDLVLQRRATEAALEAQRKAQLDAFIENQQKNLRKASASDERRMPVFGLFAAGYLKGTPPGETWRSILQNLPPSAATDAPGRRLQELRELFRGLPPDLWPTRDRFDAGGPRGPGGRGGPGGPGSGGGPPPN